MAVASDKEWTDTLCWKDVMKISSAVVEQCVDTGLYVGYVPGFNGAHSQGESLEELRANLREVIEMLLADQLTQRD